jgi:CRISPR/Cas system-associated exonuclease Cas4 (RecB family)
MNESARPNIKPLSGHVFSAYLRCPQAAWLHFHGNHADKAAPPAALRAMQLEGEEVEKKICESLYADACVIPNDSKERQRLTLEAMARGEKTILQGSLAGERGIGIVDILQRSDEGRNIYSVGEIKRAKSLGIAHVFQAMWYEGLLSQIQGGSSGQMFFHLGSDERLFVSTAEIKVDFEECQKKVLELRVLENEPGAHFQDNCSTCDWRNVCLPKMREEKHLSLIPSVTRKMAREFNQKGIRAWEDFGRLNEEELTLFGLSGREAKRIERAVKSLQYSKAVFHQMLNQKHLTSWLPLAIDDEFNPVELPERMPFHTLKAGVHKRNFLKLGGGEGTKVKLLKYFKDNTFVVYGVKDHISLDRVAIFYELEKPTVINLVEIIEDFTHVPLETMQLEKVITILGRQIEPGDPLETKVRRIESLVQWLIEGATI